MSPSAKRLAGVYPAIVTDNKDPTERGRVLVRSPVVADVKGLWARVAVPRAGSLRGTWFIPDVDDEVLIAFEAGDPRQPYVIGSLWNGANAPPEQMTSSNPRMSIVSAAGSRITLDDRPDQVSIRLETPGGRSVTVRDGDATIVIDDGAGGSITVTRSGLEIRTSGTVKLTAATAEISAAMIKLEAGMTRASGVVQCDTLIANSVVASSYTPGAGNLW